MGFIRDLAKNMCKPLANDLVRNLSTHQNVNQYFDRVRLSFQYKNRIFDWQISILTITSEALSMGEQFTPRKLLT